MLKGLRNPCQSLKLYRHPARSKGAGPRRPPTNDKVESELEFAEWAARSPPCWLDWVGSPPCRPPRLCGVAFLCVGRICRLCSLVVLRGCLFWVHVCEAASGSCRYEFVWEVASASLPLREAASARNSLSISEDAPTT